MNQNGRRTLNMGVKTIFIMWLVVTLIVACSVMDDNPISRDQFSEVGISDFEVNMQRDYIRGKIQNHSEHNITSSIFKLEIFSGSTRAAVNSSVGTVIRHMGSESLDLSKLLLSQNFMVREPLKPGYSTEFYFEVKMDYDLSDFLYTYEIVELKGH